ncbi:MAG: RluA family pseudouridine synthase [Gammaproteobacteria bacterium]
MSRIQNKKTGVRYVLIDALQEHRRIDNFLLNALKDLPKSRIYQMLRRGEIRVNGGRVKQGYRLETGDRVRIPPVLTRDRREPAPPPDYLKEMVRGSILFENHDIIALNKPAGIVVHGGSGRSFGVIEVLRSLRPSEQELQLVHRLDRETSGCLLIARHGEILRQLHSALRAGAIEKHYTALLKGRMQHSAVEVGQPLRRNVARSGERWVAIDQRGKRALTRFEVEKEFRLASLVRVRLLTGRTHQIRVHARYLQHPVAGDLKYGDKDFNKVLRKSGLKRLFLHASMLRLPGLDGHRELELKAPLSAELREFLNNYA